MVNRIYVARRRQNGRRIVHIMRWRSREALCGMFTFYPDLRKDLLKWALLSDLCPDCVKAARYGRKLAQEVS